MSLEQTKKRLLLHVLAGGLGLLAVLGTSELIVHLLHDNQLAHQRSGVLHEVATMRARLEGEINSTLHLTRGLIAYVATNPAVDQSAFTELASEIIFAGRSVRNIGLAKDNVITHLYPLVGNEAALGLDYRQVPDQWAAVRRAMDTKGTVVAGPVKLAQGGQAFIARTPIYTRTGVAGDLAQHKPAYWGMASIVIDIPQLFAAAGFAERVEDTLYALRGKDARGADGALIAGDAALFAADPVLSSVTLPNGSWQIAAAPAGGWGVGLGPLWLLRLAGWLIALLLGYLIFALLHTREVNRGLALQDDLTKLPNRRLLEDRLLQAIAVAQRNQGLFGLFFLDLNGFKQINDTHGHKAGDELLQEVAKRMRASVRVADTVARTGGDEFIILVDGIRHRSDMATIRENIEHALSGPAAVGGQLLPIQASMGTAVYPDDGLTADALLSRADQRMYSQKHGGKVRVLDVAKRQ